MNPPKHLLGIWGWDGKHRGQAFQKRGRGSSKPLHFLIVVERGFCAPFPYSANVAQPDKSEFGERSERNSEPFRATDVRQAVE